MTESRRARGVSQYRVALDEIRDFIRATIVPIFPQGHLFYEITPLLGAGGPRGPLHQLMGETYRTTPGDGAMSPRHEPA